MEQINSSHQHCHGHGSSGDEEAVGVQDFGAVSKPGEGHSGDSREAPAPVCGDLDQVQNCLVVRTLEQWYVDTWNVQ